MNGGRPNRRGQAMVEASLAFVALLMIFVCIYYTFLRGIWKIRALEASFNAGRIMQVNDGQLGLADQAVVLLSSFGHLARFRKDDGTQFSLQYLTPSPRGIHIHHTENAFVSPDIRFINRAFPNAPEDKLRSADLARDLIGLEIALHTRPLDSARRYYLESKSADKEAGHL